MVSNGHQTVGAIVNDEAAALQNRLPNDNFTVTKLFNKRCRKLSLVLIETIHVETQEFASDIDGCQTYLEVDVFY